MSCVCVTPENVTSLIIFASRCLIMTSHFYYCRLCFLNPISAPCYIISQFLADHQLCLGKSVLCTHTYLYLNVLKPCKNRWWTIYFSNQYIYVIHEDHTYHTVGRKFLEIVKSNPCRRHSPCHFMLCTIQNVICFLFQIKSISVNQLRVILKSFEGSFVL